MTGTHDQGAAARKRARAKWPIRKFRLGEEPPENFSNLTSEAQHALLRWLFSRAGRGSTVASGTRLLQRACADATKLTMREQNVLARWLVAEIESEQRWEDAFRRSQGELAALAREALAEHRRGRSRPVCADRT